jgi:excisionase family DNA binding protein
MKNHSKREVYVAEIYERLLELNGDLLLRLREVAGILKVSLRTVQRRCHDGKLVYLKVERAVRVSVTALVEYIEMHLVVKA